MKKFILLIISTLVFISCNSSNESLENSNDIIVGSWKLKSQKVDGNETATDCSKKTTFIFEADFILRQNFYNLKNGSCIAENEIISSWFNNGNSEYIIRSPDGTSNKITFNFNEDNTEFSVTENEDGSTIISVYEKN